MNCDEMRTAITLVAAIHTNGGPSQGYDDQGEYRQLGDCCTTCGTLGEYGEPWPCGTLRALGITS